MVDFSFKMMDLSFKMVDVGFKVGIHAKLNSAAYVGPCGPWTLQRVHTQAPLCKPRCFHATCPVWALGPGPFKGPYPNGVVDVGFKAGIHAKLNSAAYVGPCGPWTLQRVHTQAPLCKPRCFHATWPVWALDPSRVHTQAASWGFRRLQTISKGCGGKPFAGKALEPIQGFHLEWNPKP